MSNPWAKSFEDLRAPYLQEKKAKKDYDGDGKVESGAKEYRGVVHNKIQKAKGGKADGQDTSSVKEEKHGYKPFGKMSKVVGDARKKVPYAVKKVDEHHQKDKDGNTIPHGDGSPSSVEEVVVEGEALGGKGVEKMKMMSKQKKYKKIFKKEKKKMEKEGRPHGTGFERDFKKEETVLESDKKGKGSGTKDACYKKVKAASDVWPSAYASGRLVQCRKVGAANYGNSKKEEFDFRIKSFDELVGECWKTHKQVGTKMKGGKVVPNCVPKNEEVAVEDHVKLTGDAQKEYEKLVNMAKDKNLDMKKRQGADAALTQGGHSSVLNTKKEEAQIDELNLDSQGRMKLTAADVRLNSGAYKKSLRDTGNKVYSPVINKAHYEPKGEVIEALKGKKLDVQETGVKNKIEINPELKTEAAKAPVKK